ncbi:MAG: dehydrogenase, short-chain alcohol dehydrogenase like [Acidimicrobiales bacterium]|nr:dehydrogenase, short-chain alcohol dehydrogenase like [Acidimicrobiales bacterium]
MTDTTRLGDRVAIVTGAASGIGRATAQRLAADGARVACLDRAPGVAETAAGIVAGGGTAIALEADVTDQASTEAAVARAEAELGGPAQVLVNVAGVLRFAHAHEMSVADWDLMVDVNLKGPWLMARAVIPSMLEHGGAIVNVASSAGMFGQAYNAGYCASKGGVVLLTKALAWEYVNRGIRCNAIAPGGVETPMIEAIDFPADMDWTLIGKNTAPGNRMLDPSQPAALIAFLVSDEADGITGTVVPIDLGITC